MYAVGFTPWETGAVSDAVRQLVEGHDALSPSLALDIGCGSGTQALYLAEHGGQVTGIDVVDKPLRVARARGQGHALRAEFLTADITRPVALPHSGEYQLLLDRGCLHGLSREERAAYARTVTAIAAPGATLFIMSFARNRVPGGMRGADAAEISSLFEPDWRLVASTPDTDPAPAGPMGGVPRFWHRLLAA